MLASAGNRVVGLAHWVVGQAIGPCEPTARYTPVNGKATLIHSVSEGGKVPSPATDTTPQQSVQYAGRLLKMA